MLPIAVSTATFVSQPVCSLPPTRPGMNSQYSVIERAQLEAWFEQDILPKIYVEVRKARQRKSAKKLIQKSWKKQFPDRATNRLRLKSFGPKARFFCAFAIPKHHVSNLTLGCSLATSFRHHLGPQAQPRMVGHARVAGAELPNRGPDHTRPRAADGLAD